MPSTPISTLTLPDGNTYNLKDSNAIYEIPMAGANTLGGVKIPVSGNITIDSNGYIDAVSTGPIPSDDTPSADDVDLGGSSGTSSEYSRSDHSHPGDQNKVNKTNIYNNATTYLQQETSGFVIKQIGPPPREYSTGLKFDNGSLTISGHSVTIQNLVTPTNNTDAATKKYVDDAISGGGGTVTSVRVQGTAPISSSVNTAQTGSLDTTISISDATTTASGAMSAADKTKLDSMSGGSVWYGTSSTASSTSEKVVTCSGFTLSTGAIIGIYFSTGNTVNTPTLNINSTGAKSIFVGSASASSTNVLKWSAYTMLYFMYDGTQYRYITSISNQTVVPSRGANTWYGTSSTTASTTAKTSTIDNFVLTKGALVSITFSTANTADAPTLNINSTGAKAIYYNNAVTSSNNKLTWGAGETVTFIYSGAYYYFVCKSTAAVDISGKVDVQTIDGNYISLITNSGEGGVQLTSINNNNGEIGEIYVTNMGVTLDAIHQDIIVSAAVIDMNGVVISSQGTNGVVIQNVVTPTNNTDAANKAYVDGLVSALTNTEIDNAVAAAVTVNNANTTSY